MSQQPTGSIKMLGSHHDEEESYEADDDEFLFNEYSIDDTLDSLTRLERYHGSDFSLQRMVLVRDITDTALEAGREQTLKRLLPLLPAFVNDTESAVRQTLAEQMYPLAEFVCDSGKSEEGYQEVLNSFLPFSIELLSDRNSDVGSAAVEALFKVCTLVRPEQFEAHVLSVIQQLAHDERLEDYRVVAAELCNELAPLLGKDLCLAKIVPEVQQLADDQGFSVRKTVAAHLGKLCKTIGPDEAVAKIFPLYESLSKDMIWGVRKACAESIADISEALTPEVRHNKLADIFKSFLEDISRWVRVAASMNLGPYLFTFNSDPEPCPPSLVKLFTNMASDTENGAEADYPEFCAFNFPAVAATIGKERWSELEPAFKKLIKGVQWKVRKTLSYSLHEIAKIVGKDITENVLSEAFELFLKDLDEVRVGCLRNVEEFLGVMGQEKREQYIPEICNITDTTDSWRLRMLIGSILGNLAPLASPEFCKEQLVPMCTRMMDDSVSDVRQAIYNSVAKVLKRLCDGSYDEYETLLENIVGCAKAQSFQKRQMFAYLAKEVVATGCTDVFEKHFIAAYGELARDTVANVRLIAAKCLTEGIVSDEKLAGNEKLLGIVQLLRGDSDTDVAFFAGNPRPRMLDRAREENEMLRSDDAEQVAQAQTAQAQAQEQEQELEQQQPAAAEEGDVVMHSQGDNEVQGEEDERDAPPAEEAPIEDVEMLQEPDDNHGIEAEEVLDETAEEPVEPIPQDNVEVPADGGEEPKPDQEPESSNDDI